MTENPNNEPSIEEKVFSKLEDKPEKALLMVISLVALHGLLSNTEYTKDVDVHVDTAFNIANEFMKKMETV